MEIEHRAAGDKISPDSVNIIQDGLDEIVSLWGLSPVGSHRVSQGEEGKAAIINNWVSWLNTYASRIGASGSVSGITGVSVGDPMIYSKITSIYNGTQTVKNHCNRSECNSHECNGRECNGYESNLTSECNIGEGGKITEMNTWRKEEEYADEISMV